MLALVGIVVVIGSVVGGFLMAGGNLVLLVQPSEFVTIGGAAIGSMLISTAPAVMAKMGKQLGGVFGKGLEKEDFGQLLAMLYQVFRTAQQQGSWGARVGGGAGYGDALERDPEQVITDLRNGLVT